MGGPTQTGLTGRSASVPDLVEGAAGRSTRTFGPRPPRPAIAALPAGAGRRHRRRLYVTIGMVLLLGVGGATTTTSTSGHPRTRARPSRRPAAPNSCPAPTRRLQADVNGDGCPSTVLWRANVAEVEGRRYALGRRGDALLVGDWDCNGTDTPALYRPSTGEVFLFSGWADPGPALAASGAARFPAGGVPAVAHGAHACDLVTVKTTGPGRA